MLSQLGLLFYKAKKSNSRYLYDANKTPAVPDLLHYPVCSWVTAQASYA